jgi:hypothetical protein
MTVKTKQSPNVKFPQKTQKKTETMVYPQEQKSESEASNDELRSLIFSGAKKKTLPRGIKRENPLRPSNILVEIGILRTIS